MTNKSYGVLGMSATLLFWLTYIIMSILRPEFNLFHKAISELGSLDAPNKWYFNVFGYILPGILVAVYSMGLHKSITQDGGSKWPLIGIVLSGLLMSFAGIFPADMDQRQSTTMVLHIIGSFGSYLFFLLGAFTYPAQMKKSAYWKKAIVPTLTFTWLTILFGFWPFIFSDHPSVGQRIVFFFFFLWIFYTAVRLYKREKED